MQPLYTVSDVEKVFSRLVSVPYGRDADATKTVRFRFIEAGHVLGSAMVHLVVAAPDRDRTLTFSGDMGRRGLPILKPTGTIPPADVLVCESTYGNRTHRSFAETLEKLYAAIRDTVARGGKVLIPAFSLGRTQLIIHVLQQGLREGKIPPDADLRGQPAGVGSGRGVPGAPEQPVGRDRRGRCARGTASSAATG